MRVDRFFETARERYRIRLRREAGLPAPWTDDPVFREYRFCNVFREDDWTTTWFRTYVREPLLNASPRRQILATVAFRTFNLIETGERILPILLGRRGWDTARVLKAMEGARQIVTGAYMVHTPYGMDKLHGCCWMMDKFIEGGYVDQLLQLLRLPASRRFLQTAHAIIQEAPCHGHFTAYEIVTDLSHSVLRGAPDLLTWANPGPGAQRGLALVAGRGFGRGATDRDDMLFVMRELLRLSRPESHYWPEQWPSWTMREVEHWLCEFAKYESARRGGHMKRRFKP
jgi:hypothetical protein